MDRSEITKGLRPYQLEAIDQIFAFFKKERLLGSGCPLIVLPTGCGKTRTALAIIATYRFRNPNKRVCWLAHREELLTQTLDNWNAIYASLGHGGIVKGSKNEVEADLLFCSLSTVARPARLQAILDKGAPELIFVDEAHVSMADTWVKAIRAFDHASQEQHGRFFRVGLTATPERSDKKNLASLWEIAYHYPVWRAWEDGYLVRPTPKQVLLPELNLDELDEEGGDYEPTELARKLLASEVVAHTVACLQAHKGRHVLVFCASVQQARETAEALGRAGWVARHLCGDTPRLDRERIVSGFKEGKIKVVCNVGVLTTGADFPVCDVVVVARPTRSRTLYIQMIGRGSRLHPGKKDTLVIDMVGAEQEHPPIIAPVLIGEADAQKDEAQREVRLRLAVSKEGTEKIWKTRTVREINWLPVLGLAQETQAVACGSMGIVALQRFAGGLWMPWLIPDSPPGPRMPYKPAERLSDTPVPYAVAEALGADVARRALAVASPTAGWRTKPATEAQIRILGPQAAQLTAGEASDQLTAKAVRRFFADA